MGADRPSLTAPIAGTATVLRRPDGSRLRMIAGGDDGSPILLVHGFGVDADAWSLVAPELMHAGRRVIAYDQRGHGRSTLGRDGIGSEQLGADLRAVIEHFDLRDCIVVAHSMGCFVTAWALDADDLRARVARVVLVNPVTGDCGRGAPAARLQAPLITVGAAQRLAGIPPLGRILARMSLGRPPAAEVVEATRRALQVIPKTVAPMIGVLQRETVSDRLPRLDVPIHVIAGGADRTTPLWHAELIERVVPSATLEVVPGGGHMLPWEQSGRVVRAALGDQVQAQPPVRVGQRDA